MELVSQEQKKRFIILASLLVALQVMDGALTTLILNRGLGYEGMPVVAPIAGYWWFSLVKFGITALVLFALYKRLKGNEKSYKLANKGLMIIAVIFVLIVVWNTLILTFGASDVAIFPATVLTGVNL